MMNQADKAFEAPITEVELNQITAKNNVLFDPNIKDT